mgnify:CR=1 FL=1
MSFLPFHGEINGEVHIIHKGNELEDEFNWTSPNTEDVVGRSTRKESMGEVKVVGVE